MADRACKFWVALSLAALALVALAPAEGRGQSFAFAVGSGGGHHHRTGWSFGYGVGPYWGPGWGPGWWGPPAVVYAPPPVVQPIYVQPQTVLPVAPGPTPYTTSVPSSPPVAVAADRAPSLSTASAADDRIVIRNMAGAQLPVAFLVDGQDLELADGAMRTFVGKTHRTVQYDRGGRFGSTQQDLTGGQYEFRITSSGWDLVRKADVVSSSRTAVRSNSLPDSSVAR